MQQPLPNLLQQHADALAAFQAGCFAFCQRLLEAFAIALDVSLAFLSFFLPPWSFSLSPFSLSLGGSRLRHE
jgi:isopenicillin N synthase-like dioxygenase